MGKKTLLSQVLKEKPIHAGPPSWEETLRKSDPERMAQIDELIDAFIGGLCKGWSRAQIVRRIIAFGAPVKDSALDRYIESRREARNAKATD